jgi:hypothetical protein
MDVEWFAFVLLPIGVTLLGALLTGVGLKLIDIATPRQARTDGRLSRWWVAVDVAAALAGVAALDLLVETF